MTDKSKVQQSRIDGLDTTISGINTAISGKADKATTLSGYGITDAYTQTAINNKLNGKGNSTTPVYFDANGNAVAITSYSGKAATAGVADSANSVAWSDVDGAPSEYTPAAHNQASNTINAMTGYNKASGSNTAVSTSDTLNVAIAKLENQIDSKQASGSYVPTTRKINNKALTADITLTASDVNALPSSTTIPTITDTYSATSSNGMSGKAVASAISGKQDTISDLSTIRSGAESGATAVQPAAISDMATKTWVGQQGYTSNTGTITGITMNGTSKGTSGVVNLGTVITDISGKQDTITGAATTVVSSNLTANRALISNGSGKIAVSNITSTELNYLDNLTGNIQSQIDGKQATLTAGSNITISNNVISATSGGASVPVGSIIPYGGSTAPTGYLLCDGSAISRTTYSALFSAIGTAYGAGDGNSTFNLPNGSQGGGRSLWGNVLGYISSALPDHNHTFTHSTSPGWSGGGWASGTNITESTSYASSSNNIYGAATYVRPQAIGVNYIILY